MSALSLLCVNVGSPNCAVFMVDVYMMSQVLLCVFGHFLLFFIERRLNWGGIFQMGSDKRFV